MGASERNEQARGAFRERLMSLDPKKRVFVDESGTNMTLAPLYGWVPKGEGLRQGPEELGEKCHTHRFPLR